ncbi:MAG: hypothetical protein NT094_01455 [Candidatus Staskawiczbacteria bacterium]|nr:hypothetical protein [Candidatus Staskawiczbacteria bacterium]
MTTETKETIYAVKQNTGLMNFIIGKAWTNQGTNRPGNININRDLPHDLVLQAGTTLLLTEQKKREGKLDADYNVSILLPVETAQKLIEETKALTAARHTDTHGE